MGIAARTTSTRGRWGRGLAVLTVAGLLAAGVAAAPAASAEGTGGISGVVTGPDGPVEGIDVGLYAFDPDWGEWSYLSDAYTDAEGAYFFTGLDDQSYRVGFFDLTSGLKSEFYDDAATLSTATDVPVGDTVVSGIDADLARKTHLTGTVTDDATGDPLPGVTVTAYTYDAGWEEWWPASGGPTDENGFFDLADLEPGTYRLRYTDYGDHVDEYWNGSPTVEAADDIDLEAGQTVPGLDAGLATPSHVTGTVTDAQGVPVLSAEVTAYRPNTDGDWTSITSAYTDGEGRYDLPLPAGTYRIGFRTYDGQHSPEYWNDAATVDAADDVVLGSSATVEIDAELADPTHVTGTVTGPSGENLVNVGVGAFRYDAGDDEWSQVESTSTDTDGEYDLVGLDPGTYRIQFNDYGGDNLTEWWDDAPSVDEADDVTLAASETRAGIDAQLSSGGHLQGTVRSGTTALSGVGVAAYRWDAENEYWDTIASDTTDASGAYDIGGLDAGTYHLGFDGGSGYLDEYYDDKPTVQTATDVTLTRSQTRSGLDANLLRASHITGTVTGVGDTPIVGAEVDVYRWSDDQWRYVDDATTGTGGTYDVGGLTAGDYRVGFSAPGHVSEYYQDAETLTLGDDVAVTAGGTASGINARLDRAGSISGTVTAEGDPTADVDDVRVVAQRFDEVEGQWIREGSAYPQDGDYSITRLRPGTYRVCFQSEYVVRGECWNDAPRLRGAQDIALAAGQDRTGINAALAPYGTPAPDLGSISGTVNGASGALANVDVVAYRYYPEDDYWDFVDSDDTDATGRYRITGLRDGVYRIGFQADGYTREYYDDQPFLSQAQNVTVADGGERAGVNATLTIAPTLSGKVTSGTATGPAEEDVRVSAWRQTPYGFEPFDSTWTREDGTYRLTLVPGTYRLQFTARGRFAPEWWNDAPTLAAAQDIVVPATGEVAGKDAVLTPGSSISGRLTDEVTGADITGVMVTVWKNQGDYWSEEQNAEISTPGTWTVRGLEPGEYRLQFSSGLYIDEFWNDAGRLQLADSFVVGSADTLTGKDVALRPGGAVSGTVTNASGTALDDVDVTLFRFRTGSGWTDEWTKNTDATGKYSFPGLSYGTYRLRFSDGGDTGYATEYYDGASTLQGATDVLVRSPAPVTGRDAVLEQAAARAVRGTVTDSGARPVPDTRVTLYEADGDGWSVVDETTTGPAGGYRFTGMDAGSYRVGFDNRGYAVEYHPNARSLGEGADVAVGTGESVVNAQLEDGAAISGAVTGPGGADAVGVQVTALRRDPTGDWNPVRTRYVNQQGTYTVGHLAPGTYRLEFSDPSEEEWPAEFWDNSPTLAGATDLVLAGTALTGRNAVLGDGGSISGVVSDSSGPVAEADVRPYAKAGSTWVPLPGLTTSTGEDGTYTLDDLVPGTYRIAFDDQYGEHALEFWNDKTTLTAATDLVVTSGSSAPGTNAVLGQGGRITGTITGSGGPIANAQVTAYRLDPATGQWEPTRYGSSDDSGAFTVRGLAADTYRLQVHAFGYRPAWFGGQDAASATGIPVATNATVSGRDVQLVAHGFVAGRVTDADGAPLDDILVAVYGLSGGSWTPVTSARTDEDGGYRIRGLSDGTYRLAFDDPRGFYGVQWYDGGARLSEATDLVITTDAPRTGLDATLTRAGDAPALRNRTVPTISGSPTVGSTLTATSGTWSTATGVTYAYEWFAGTTSVKNGASNTYVPTSSDVGKPITVKVTAARSGYTSGTAESAPTANVSNQPPVASTSAPTITGTPVVGGTLTASTGGWNPSTGLTHTYEWFAGITSRGAPSSTNTYAPTSADVGQQITVKVTASKSGFAPGSATSAPTAAVQLPALPNTAKPTITGTPEVGSALTASTGTWNPADGVTYAYQWKVGSTNVGTNANTYTPVAGDAGSTVTVTVTATRSGYRPTSETSNPTAAVQQQVLPSTAKPTITGTPEVGSQLTASTGVWNPADGVTYAYQWKVGSTNVGTNANTYTPVAGDAGSTVTVTVTATRNGYRPGTSTSNPTAAVQLAVLPSTAKPVVTGTPEVGSPLTASTGTWNPADGVTYAYQWKVGGSNVGTNSNTYTPVAGDAGSTVTVTVTATRSGYRPGTSTSDPTTAVQPQVLPNTAKPTITGTPEVGSALTASTGTWNPADGVTYAYQWKVGGTNVGTNSNTYTPVVGDAGSTVTVTVTATRNGYQAGTSTSNPTAAVQLPALPNTAAPVITGTPQVGSPLQASTGTWNPGDGVTYAYQWKVGGTDVGSNSNTYTPVDGDAGSTVTVVVTATRSGYRPTSATSQPTAAVAGPPITNTAPPTITGTAKVGQTLTAQPGTWNPTSGLTYAYQWFVGTTAVPGVTTSTYVLPATAVGKTVRVEVTASGPGRTPVTTSSAATPAVGKGTLRLTRAPSFTGTLRVGQTLRGVAGSVSPGATSVTYQWLRNGAAIRGATRSTYRLVAGDRNKRISLKVTYVRAGYTSLAKTTAAKGPVR